MKQVKTIFKILIVFLLITQNSFATTKPIIGIGIVVKKNPGSGYISVPTGNGGGFSAQLEEGVYELSFPQDQLQTSINGIVKADYPKSGYKYDGSGVEMILDNSQITVNSKSSDGNRFAIDKQNSSITIKVAKGGATLSGKLSWNDAVLQKSEISCPDGFIMQNGECVPINNTGNQQARTEGKTKGKIKDPGSKSPMRTAGNQQARTEGKTKGKIVKAGNNGMISVSLNANGGTSSSSGVDNSFSFNPSLGIATHWKNFGIGLDAGTFNTKPNFDFDAYAAPLQNLDFLTTTNTKNDWTSTYFMLGPQYTVTLSPSQNKESGRHTPFHNKLTFTLALKGGLTINKAPEFSVIDKSTPPKNIASYTAPQDYKTNTISLKPSISFDYWINENIALTANAQYLMQTGQKEFTTGYIDLTNVNLAPPISPDQFQKNISTAPKVMTNTKGPENYMSFGIGIIYSFRKGWDGTIKGNKSVENTSNETQRKGWDGSIKGKNIAEKGITENGLKKNDFETTPNETQRKGIKENGLKKSDVGTTSNETQRKGWDGSVKGKNIAEKGINENGLKKNDVKNAANETQRKGITEGGLPKNDVETVLDETQKIAIKEQGVKKSDVENVINEAEVKQIAEIVVNFRKGWDGSIKGNKIENLANEADVKAIAETLVNLARKGWDGSIKGNKIENATKEADVKTIAETLVNIRKGWDGSIKGNKVENVANEADVKAIAETLVNLRKGWDGTVKGGSKTELKTTSDETQRKGIQENGLKKNDESVKAGISENKGLNAVSVKMSKADSGKNSTADGLTAGNKTWTCPCCNSEFTDYAPSHETKCCDLKFFLLDVNRPFNENDNVTFVENVAISIKSNTSSAIIPSQIALVYKIKQDDKGKLYGIPSIIFGIDIPQDSIPNYTLGCNSPCAVIGIAGNCGGFCYRLLPMDRPPQDYGPSEGPIAFNPNSTGTIVFIKDEKLTSIEQTNINSVKYTVSTTGKINTGKIFSNSNFCYTYIEGYGTIAFEHIFSATCETASNYIKELYSKTHKTQQKKN